MFVNLRAVTSASLTAGIIHIPDLIKKIANNPDKYYPAVGLANTNNMMDNTDLFKNAEKSNIKPISSVELDIAYIETSTTVVQEAFETREALLEKKNRHGMLFIAKNFNGYQNLCKLQTIFYQKSKNAKRRAIESTVFQEYPELLDDVYILSGGINSGEQKKQTDGSYLFHNYKQLVNTYQIYQQFSQQGKDVSNLQQEIQKIQDNMVEYIEFWRDISNGNFFIELQRQGTELENEYIQYIVPIANDLGVPVIATHNVYFLNPEDYESHEYMLAYRGGYNVFSNENSIRKPIHCTPNNYLKTNQEIIELFSDIPTAVNNAYLLAETCGFELRPQKNHFYMPEIQSSNPNENIEQMFERIAKDGLDVIMLKFFKQYADKQSIFNQKINPHDYVDKEDEYKLLIKKNYLPDNQYFRGFIEWKTSGLSSDTHSDSEILAYIKTTKQYQKYYDRLIYELDVIKQMGFASYFVVVSDMVSYAKDNSIPVGIGRGSGAGSLVAYTMKITDLDPLQFDLLFERFLNPERNSMPDFDIDFEKVRRGEIFSYLAKKYNSLGNRLSNELNPILDKYLKSPSMAQISTLTICGTASSLEIAGAVLGSLNNKGGFTQGIKEIFNANDNQENLDDELVLDIDESEVSEKSFYTPQIVNDQNFKYHQLFGQTFKKVSSIASHLYGQTRGFSTHAAGAILSPHRLDEITPILVDANGHVVAQQNMKNAEYLGLIKFDILGLLTLSYIDAVVKEINKTEPMTFNDLFQKINIYDLNVYENIFQKANTDNIFQFESEKFKETLMLLQPNCFEDLVAAVALFRPGAKKFIPDYAPTKKGIKERVNLAPSTPEVSEILDDTYGFLIYQEQVILIVQKYAGYTAGEADILRRAMGKKDMDLMQKERERFVERVVKRFPPDRADEIAEEASSLFGYIQDFAEYGFNKSHAAAYAMTSYITAWLKYYYPHQFVVGHLNVMNNYNRKEVPKTLIDAENNQVIVKSTVDINHSDIQYALNDKKEVVLPLILSNINPIKAEKIIHIREDNPFINISDFLSICAQNNLTFTEKELTSLIQSGAFNQLQAQEYGEMLVNTKNLLESTAKTTGTNINPLFKFLPNNILNVKSSLNNKSINFFNVTRKVPYSEQLKAKYKLFGFLPNQQDILPLTKSVKNQLLMVKDNNHDRTFESLFVNITDLKRKIYNNLANQVSEWSKKAFRNPETKFHQNVEENAMIWGYLVAYKKSKDSVEFKIQTESDTIRIYTQQESFKNMKFDLMSPYIFKISCRVAWDYQPESPDDHNVEKAQLRWNVIDVFPLNNVFKQLGNIKYNKENLPRLDINTNESAEQKSIFLMQLCYDNFALSDADVKSYESSLILDKDNIEISYNNQAIDVVLPNANIISIYFNDALSQAFKQNKVQLSFSFDNNLIEKNGLLSTNGLQGNLVKSDGLLEIKNTLNHPVFNALRENWETINSGFFNNPNKILHQGEHLLYGYVKNAYYKEGELNRLIMVDELGKDIKIDAKFGRLAAHNHNIKIGQPLLVKINYYFSSGKDNLRLDDFYTADDIQTIIPDFNQHFYIDNGSRNHLLSLLQNNNIHFDIINNLSREQFNQQNHMQDTVRIRIFANFNNYQGFNNESICLILNDDIKSLLKNNDIHLYHLPPTASSKWKVNTIPTLYEHQDSTFNATKKLLALTDASGLNHHYQSDYKKMKLTDRLIKIKDILTILPNLMSAGENQLLLAGKIARHEVIKNSTRIFGENIILVDETGEISLSLPKNTNLEYNPDEMVFIKASFSQAKNGAIYANANFIFNENEFHHNYLEKITIISENTKTTNLIKQFIKNQDSYTRQKYIPIILNNEQFICRLNSHSLQQLEKLAEFEILNKEYQFKNILPKEIVNYKPKNSTQTSEKNTKLIGNKPV